MSIIALLRRSNVQAENEVFRLCFAAPPVVVLSDAANSPYDPCVFIVVTISFLLPL